MGLFRFLLFDGLGACIWVAFFIGLGFLFSHQIEEVAQYALKLSGSLLGVLIASLATFVLWKYAQRRRLLRHLAIARITPEELKHKLDDGEHLMILDVRHQLEFEAEPKTIPGAFHFPLEQLQKEIPSFPRDREIIFYCN
jgi:ABC-type nickel/cobalt efflux system permease component RcnA